MSEAKATVLRKAADIIRERGWTQGQFMSRDGKYCVSGAIAAACGGKNTQTTGFFDNRADEDLACDTRAYLDRVLDIDFLGDWNDDRDRTKEEVLAALEKAAELAETT